MPEEGTTTTAAAQDTTQATTTATETATTTETGTEATTETLLKKPEDGKPEGEKPEGEKKDGAKPEGEQPAKVVPEKYEYTPPEGVTVDAATLESFTPLAKELGLSQEDFTKLADWQAANIKAAGEANVKAYQEQQQTWAKEFKDSPEFGGEKFDASIRGANEFYAKFSTKEELALIHQFGLQNFPPLVALAARAHAALMADDKLHLPEGSREAKPETLAKQMFRDFK